MPGRRAASSLAAGALCVAFAACKADPAPPAPPAPSPIPLPSGAKARDVSDTREVPSVRVKKRVEEAPVIDGRLDERVWFEASRLGPFVGVSTGRYDERSPVQGEVRVTWDDAFFYAGFEVRDKDVRGGFPADAIDPHLWERDTVELMLDPDGDGDNVDYYELQVSPQNLVFDSQFDTYNGPKGGPAGPFGHQEWSAKQTSAVGLRATMDEPSDEDDGYTIELKVPWASFTKARENPPKPGATWRMNFYAMQNNGGVAWSPILGQGNFHRASRFGKVTFVE
jgi:hypothetical protein